VGLVLVLPDSGLYNGQLSQPAFFRDAAQRRELRAGETVLLVPFGQNAPTMLWQAQARLAFRMPEGYLSGVIPAEFRRAEPLTELLVAGGVPPASQLAGFLSRHHVAHVVVQGGTAVGPAWVASLQALRWRGTPRVRQTP